MTRTLPVAEPTRPAGRAPTFPDEAGRAVRQPGRTLLGYLLVPRPKDLTKGLLVPVAFAVGVLAVGGTTLHQVLRGLVVWVALELLVYASRYQWNDIRGFVADQQHPGERDRGRLPGPVERARERVLLSSIVAIARLASVAVLVVALPGLDLAVPLTAVTLAVFGVAVLYEALRARATGRTGAVPARPRPVVVALWLVVGAGYAVRGVTGLAFAVDLTARPLLAAAAVVALWSFGVAFVTGRWALEALAFARLDGRWLICRARPDQAREHTLALVRWLPREVPDDVGDPAGWAALRGRTALSAPWNLAAVLAGAASALTGYLLTGGAADARVAVVAAAGAAAAAAVVLTGSRPVVLLVGAGSTVALLAALGVDRPLLGALPWLVVLGAHVRCTRQSLNTLGGVPLRGLGRVVRQALVPVARTVLGPATWAAVGRRPGRTAR